MNEEEYQRLFELNAELNSPETRAILEEVAKLQEIYNEDDQCAEPIEAKPYIPYVETPEFECQIQDLIETEKEIANQIQSLQTDMESEKQARLKSEKVNTRFQWANLIFVALTLLATGPRKSLCKRQKTSV